MNLDYSHCLRQTFTHTIYNRLKDGASLNLVGEKYTGRQRLLEDIQGLAMQEGIIALVIDVNAWKHHYSGFVQQVRQEMAHTALKIGGEALQQQLEKANTPVPLIGNTQTTKPEYLTTVLAQRKVLQKRLILLLNNFDVLFDNPQQRFPKYFFDDLNALQNQTGVSLCCVTLKPHLQSRLYYEDEHGKLENTLSWLNLQTLPSIPKLTQAEARTALNKALSQSIQWQEEPQKERFVTALADHRACRAFLEIVCNSFLVELENMPAEIRLEQCYHQYRENYYHRPSPTRWKTWLTKKNIEWAINQLGKLIPFTKSS